jgi:hypothetical protein
MLIRLIPLSALFALLIFSRLVGAQQLAQPSVVGNAYDKSTGYFLYSENHFCEEDRLQCTVKYLDSYGLMFAMKQLDYRESSLSPSLVMTDYRLDVETRVPATEQNGLVVDAGFDNFVRSIWEVLDAGDKAKFPFLVAGFDKPIKMIALQSAATDCTTTQLCLEIKLDSWFLGMLVDPIELSYSRTDKRLRRFSGVSNIKNEEGESLNVNIQYQYADEILLVGPLIQQRKTDFNL